MSPEDSRSGGPAGAGPRSSGSPFGGTPKPLGETKPPREWRSVRQPDAKLAPPPRIAKSVAAETSHDPAGSFAPAADHVPGSPPAAPAEWHSPQAAEAEFPARYGVDRLVFLVRDPSWIYAWWELTEPTLASGRRTLAADASLVLRVYDVTAIDWDGTNHHVSFDVEVWDLLGNWYIELGRPGSSFVGELGLRARDGRFLALVRSNFVTMPRDSMSPVVDEEWMVVEEDYRLLFGLAGGGDIGLGSGEIQRMLEQRLRTELASGGVSSFGISSFGVSSPGVSSFGLTSPDVSNPVPRSS
jgi:hypothetical protein